MVLYLPRGCLLLLLLHCAQIRPPAAAHDPPDHPVRVPAEEEPALLPLLLRLPQRTLLLRHPAARPALPQRLHRQGSQEVRGCAVTSRRQRFSTYGSKVARSSITMYLTFLTSNIVIRTYRVFTALNEKKKEIFSTDEQYAVLILGWKRNKKS